MTTIWLLLFGMVMGVGLTTLCCLAALAGGQEKRALRESEAERRAVRRVLLSRPIRDYESPIANRQSPINGRTRG